MIHDITAVRILMIFILIHLLPFSFISKYLPPVT